MKQLRVLVVDDDLEVCEFLRAFLLDEGYLVDTLCDPARAIQTLKKSEYHVVILDLAMQHLSGLELLHQIRHIDSDIAVIMLTGVPCVDTAAQSVALDISAYLTKPVSTMELRDTMARVIRRKGLVRSREEEMHVTIGRKIRGLRHDKKLTLAKLAGRTGHSVSLLSQIERAESSASVSTLYKIARALGVKLTTLFGDC